MDPRFVDGILTGDSDEIADLKANLATLEGFIELIREISALPGVKSRFYEESRSLFQTTATGRDVTDLEKLLAKFFGPPAKPAGKSLPRKLRKSSVVKYLGGIQKDQALFIISLKTGHFYGALWPWRRNKAKIEIHLGYCSDWMTDEDYQQVETLVHQHISHSTFEQMDASIGGQIHGISLPSFLQMAEMEKSTFTLRITSPQRAGALHLCGGNLVAAQLDDLAGPQAAYRIISWDDVTIDIEPLSSSETDEIKQPLMHVLMQSLKLKDEATIPRQKPPALPRARPQTAQRRPEPTRPAKRLIRLERARKPEMRKKRPPLLALAGIAGGIFAVLAVIVVATFHILDNRHISDGYQELLSKADQAPSLEQKLKLLEAYLDDNPGSAHTKSIQVQIQSVHAKIEDREYEQTTLKVSALPVDEQYETQAIDLFSQFLKKYPHSRHTQKINQAIAEIKNLLDKYYYEELVRAARLDFNQRLEIYQQYLAQFPEGSYRRDVEVLINEMGAKYLAYLRDESIHCQEKRRWESCIQRCDNFINAYRGTALSRKAILLKNQWIDKRDHDQLRRRAEDAGTDYRKAYQIYRSYLNDHPASTQKAMIETEIAALGKKLKTQQKWLAVRNYATDPKNSVLERIQRVDRYLRDNLAGEYAGEAQTLVKRLASERQASLRKRQAAIKQRDEQARILRQREEQARRQQRMAVLQTQLTAQLNASGRYRPNGDGTVTDRTSGLMWTLLDSHQTLDGCVDYDGARQYVRAIKQGGYHDWRLPSASELAAIYKQAPFYPGSGAQWYWSSEAYTKGYHTVADVVTARPETVYQRESRPQNECGAVRAVRPLKP